MRNEQVLDRLCRWALGRDDVRILRLGGSRVLTPESVDALSDYDVEVGVLDTELFRRNDDWLHEFGTRIAAISQSARTFSTKAVPDWHVTRLVLFDDGVRIDFQIFSVQSFHGKPGTLHAPSADALRVLVDKDGIVATPEPTKSHAIQRPEESSFQEVVNDFWWDTTYVAKSFWRGELYYARYMMEGVIRPHYLTSVLEWTAGFHNNWEVNPNKHGRWLHRYLDAGTWAELESTFYRFDAVDGWNALFAMTRLFARLSRDLAGGLRFSYPEKLEAGMVGYLERLRGMKPGI